MSLILFKPGSLDHPIHFWFLSGILSEAVTLGFIFIPIPKILKISLAALKHYGSLSSLFQAPTLILNES